MRAQGSVTIRKAAEDGKDGKNGNDGAPYTGYAIVTDVEMIGADKDGWSKIDGVTIYTELITGDVHEVVEDTYEVTFIGDDDSVSNSWEGDKDNPFPIEGADLSMFNTMKIVSLKYGLEKVIPIVKDGAQGEPGADGESSISLEVSTNALLFTSNVTTLSIDATLYKGGAKIPRSSYMSGSLSSELNKKVTYTGWTYPDDNTSTLTLVRLNAATDFAGTLTISCKYNNQTYTKVVQVAWAQGEQGIDGSVMRTTEWTEGTTYNDGTVTEDNGLRYTDVVTVTDSDSGELVGAYVCVKPHTATTDDKPTDGANSANYWEQMSVTTPIYTSLILAEQANIRLAQAQQLIIVDDSGNVVGRLGGGDVPFWLGAADTAKACFQVDKQGKLTAGLKSGQRIEIEPETKQIKIYDESGNLSTVFEGRTYDDMSEFFGSGEVQTTSVSFTVDSVTVNTLNTAPKYVTATSAPKYLPKPKKLSFAGSSKVTLSLTAGSSTKYTAKSSKIEVVTYLDEYSDSGATELKSTKRLDKVELDGLGTLTYDFATLPETYISGGAYYVVRVECALAPTILPIGATDNSTTPDITVTASIKQTSGSNITVNIKANDTGYVSRHFANGLCLASATDNYTLIKYDSTDGTMSFETRAGAYGLQVTSDGIKKYDGTTWIDADI